MTKITDTTQNTSAKIYNLKKPVKIDGQTYTKIELDLDSLKAEDMLAIEQSMQSDGFVVMTMAEMSKAYLLYVAARSAKINPNVLKQFSIADSSKITGIVQSFLLQA